VTVWCQELRESHAIFVFTIHNFLVNKASNSDAKRGIPMGIDEVMLDFVWLSSFSSLHVSYRDLSCSSLK